MRLTIAFELPKDFTEAERKTFKDNIQSAAMESIKNIFDDRGHEISEQVAESMKVEEAA